MPVIVTIVLLSAAAGLTLVTALLASAETAIQLLTRGRARRLVEAERHGADQLSELVESPGRTLAATAVARGGAYATSAIFLALLLAETYDLPTWAAAVLGLLIGWTTVFLLADALPHALAVQNPEGVGLTAARWAFRMTALLFPVAKGLSAAWSWLLGMAGGEVRFPVPWVTDDEYRSHVGESDEEAAHDEAEEEIMTAVVEFRGKIVREVMIPRTDMHVLEDTATAKEALDLIEKTGVSRLPVYHETADDVRGVLYAKDLLVRMGREGSAVRPADIVRPAYFVPETKPVSDLLLEMRTMTHLAIVADEYGGTAGLVTIEDLLEEIVGEIFDEYDLQRPLVIELGERRYRVDSRLPVDDVNEMFGTAIEADADTVGGLFTELAGHIPDPGETEELEGLRLTAETMEGARILTLLVEPAETRNGQGGNDD